MMGVDGFVGCEDGCGAVQLRRSCYGQLNRIAMLRDCLFALFVSPNFQHLGIMTFEFISTVSSTAEIRY